MDPAALVAALQRFGIPNNICRIVQAIYANRKFQVRDSGTVSSVKDQLSGISQGCPLFSCVMTILLHDAAADMRNNEMQPCCFAKILEGMILNRIHPIVDPILDDCQAGFRWGSDLQAYSFFETLSMRRHTRTYCAFMDIRKAFDVAWQDGASFASTVPASKMACGI